MARRNMMPMMMDMDIQYTPSIPHPLILHPTHHPLTEVRVEERRNENGEQNNSIDFLRSRSDGKMMPMMMDMDIQYTFDPTPTHPP